MKKILIVLLLVCSLSSGASAAQRIIYGPGDAFLGWALGKACDMAYDYLSQPHQWANDLGQGNVNAALGGGGGGGW